jgi:DnaJ-class molecular chaperone
MIRMMSPQMPRPRGTRGKPCESTFYDELGVPVNAHMDDIKRSFRRMSIKKHPDKGGKSEEFQQLLHAYNVISDEEKRYCYDAFGANYEKQPGIEVYRHQLRSSDVREHLELTLAECLQGKTCSVAYSRFVAPGGVEQFEHVVNVPPGTLNGHPFVYDGLGHKEPGKPIPGRLILIVKETPSDDFQRHGNILIHNKIITLHEALSGESVQINHPNGCTLHISPTSVFGHNKWYKLPSKGGTPDFPMFVHTTVEIPELTDDQRRRLMEILGPSLDRTTPHETIQVDSINIKEIEEEVNHQTGQDDSQNGQNGHPGQPGCQFQ